MIWGLILLALVGCALISVIVALAAPLAWAGGRIQQRGEQPCLFCGEPLGWNS